MDKNLNLKVSQKIGGTISTKMRFAMVELDALEYMGELIKAPNSAQLLVKLIRMMSYAQRWCDCCKQGNYA